MELRDYQQEIINKALPILKRFGLVYLALEPRVGKTLCSLTIANLYGAKNVLFLTKLKAISSIESDYSKIKTNFKLTVKNYESAHKLIWDFDLVICDESHLLSQMPKPSNRTKNLKERVKDLPIIYLSATPTPETLSQIYHQLWISSRSPFAKWTNFYKWSHDFVNIKKKYINGYDINDYSHAKEAEIQAVICPYMVNLSQAEAGFTSFVDEEILTVPIDKRIYRLMDVLKKDKIYTMQCGDVILADTPVKLQSLYHQLSSGTVKIDDKKSHIIDESKAWFIKQKFAGQKIAIFYKFIQEGILLRRIFENHTDNPELFNKHDHYYFVCQIVSGREGTNLSTADALVMYNIDFSATSYWQARARMQTKDRVKASKLFWIFSENGLEHHVYKAVVKKKNFTTIFFKKAYGIK